jgi:AmmeMemoRadiSam system protein A
VSLGTGPSLLPDRRAGRDGLSLVGDDLSTRGVDRSAGAPSLSVPGVEELLVGVADRAVRRGLGGQPAHAADLDDVPDTLCHPVAVFVTITVDGELNGCIGTLTPEPLAAAVYRLAWDAAFADPRLPRLTGADYPRAHVKISMLSEPEPIDVATEQELIAELRPGVDGLVIESRGRRATFLPAVWDLLPDPAGFVAHLKRKAGIRIWQVKTRAWRYTTIEVGGMLCTERPPID